jgi:hypothetical protein
MTNRQLSKIDQLHYGKGLCLGDGLGSETLTREEFASLLTVANTCAVSAPPAVIPAEHSARLIALGYMAYVSGSLRMTSPGRRWIKAGFKLTRWISPA